jgi:pilus assembly protein Flp/PilA
MQACSLDSMLRAADRPTVRFMVRGVLIRRSGESASDPSGFNASAVRVESMSTLNRFLRDESGATAIEYGLIAAGIALAIIAAVNGLGVKLSGKFTSVNNSLK